MFLREDGGIRPLSKGRFGKVRRMGISASVSSDSGGKGALRRTAERRRGGSGQGDRLEAAPEGLPAPGVEDPWRTPDGEKATYSGIPGVSVRV